MKAKTYLNTTAFRVSCPNQNWGGRKDQLLLINKITVNYNIIMNNFTCGIVDRVIEDCSMMQHFSSWQLLFDAINNFITDVELTYPLELPEPSLNYDGDLDSDSDLDILIAFNSRSTFKMD